MPVTADQVAEISRNTVDLYKAAEQAIVREVTRHLGAGLDIPDWAATRLGALATLRGTVQRMLALVLPEAAQSIRAALAHAYRRGQAEATTGIPARLLPRDSDAVRAAAVVAEQVPRAGVIENLAAALVQDVGARHSNVVRHVIDGYQQVIAQATAVSVAGGMTRRQAAQHAYQKLVDQGLTSFTDVSGRRWRLSSYVEMGVRTVTQRAAVQGQTDRQIRMGLPFVVVSNEVQECFLCRPYEGRVLRIDAGGQVGVLQLAHAATGEPVAVHVLTTLDVARAAGFQHPNCRHSVRAYLPGVTKLPPRPTADKEGDQARQRQRAIERAIRKYKERELAALDPAAAVAARGKVKLWQGQMRDHLAAHPALKRLPYREQIGAGNIPPGRRPGPATPPPAPAPAGPPPAPAPAAPLLPQRRAVRQPPARVEDLPGLLDLDFDAQLNRAMARDVFADIFGGDYAGLTVEVQEVSSKAASNRPGFLVAGQIFPADDLNASEVGNWARGYYRDRNGDLVAIHALLELHKSAQGKGFGSEFTRHLEEWDQAQGVSRIEVHADIDVGGYTWATKGYEFEDEDNAERVIEKLRFTYDVFNDLVDDLRAKAENASPDQARTMRKQARQLEAQMREAADILERADTEAFGSDGYPSAFEISQCGRTDDTGDPKLPWLGKATMLGSNWYGVKWL